MNTKKIKLALVTFSMFASSYLHAQISTTCEIYDGKAVIRLNISNDTVKTTLSLNISETLNRKCLISKENSLKIASLHGELNTSDRSGGMMLQEGRRSYTDFDSVYYDADCSGFCFKHTFNRTLKGTLRLRARSSRIYGIHRLIVVGTRPFYVSDR